MLTPRDFALHAALGITPAAIAESLAQSIAELSERLGAERKASGGKGRRALDRDQAIHHLKEALSGYRQVGASRDDARIRRRLRQHGVRRRHWTTPPARPVTGWASLTATEQTVAKTARIG